MKKYLLVLTSAALLLAGCAKEQIVDQREGGLTNVTFTANLESDAATKAVADNDGNGVNVNRCIMEIYFQNELYKRMVETTTSGVATFSNVPVVAGKQYKVLFWADCGNNKGDKYYQTGNLKSVTVNETAFEGALAAGKNDELDAFFYAGDYTVPQGGATYNDIKLHRPFAQLNVITTDVGEGKTVFNAGLLPETVTVSYTAFNKFNVADSTVSGSATYNYTAPVYGTWSDDKSELTLSMDYILAAKEKGAVDVTFSTSTGMSHSLANLPYKRNYRTNVKGDLLTTGGTWTATIAPEWAEPDYDVPFLSASTIAEAQNYIAPTEQGTQKAKVVDLSKATIKTTDLVGSDEDKKIQFILKNTSPADMVNFTLPAIPAGVISAGCTGWKITYEDGYPTQNVNVTAPVGTNVTIEAPNSHVTLNGEEYEQVTASTDGNTLVVPKGVKVVNLVIKQGGLEIHGIVDHLTITPDQGVAVKACENLNSEVYAIAKQHIAEGYIADDATNSIVKKDFVQDENGVWHIMNAKAYKEFAAAVNGGTTFQGQTVVLDADIDFQNATVAPIGNFTDNTPFKGTFDGNNKKLCNVIVQNVTGKMGVGIFGKVYAPCVIKDLVVEGANVIGNKETAGDKAIAYVGGIAGHGYATIQNCTFRGDIYAGHQMGGIAGSGGFTIKGCTFEGNIISERYWGLGGIIGNCQDGGEISGNSAKGTISAKGSDPLIAGGIIGAPLYTTYNVKNNHGAMSMTYNGESFENVYPIVGVYNEDEVKTATDFEKLLSTLADNTWDKTISPNDSYAIIYHSTDLTKTGYVINYGAATSEAIVAKIGETGYTSLEAAIAAATETDVIELFEGEYTTYGTTYAQGQTLTFKGVEGMTIWKYGKNSAVSGEGGSDYSFEGSTVTFKNITLVDNYTVNSYYRGFVRAEGLTFEKCTFKNMMGYLGVGDVHFTNCVFDVASDCEYAVKCYSGKDFYFDGCTFKGNNKANIQLYIQDGSDTVHKVQVKDCKFYRGSDKSRTAVYYYDQGATEGGIWEIHLDGNNENLGEIAVNETSGSWLWGTMKYNSDNSKTKIYEGDKLVWQNGAKVE